MFEALKASGVISGFNLLQQHPTSAAAVVAARLARSSIAAVTQGLTLVPHFSAQPEIPVLWELCHHLTPNSPNSSHIKKC